MSVKILLLVSALLVTSSFFTCGLPVDTRAACKIVWLVGIPCSEATVAVVTQLKAMGSYKLGAMTPALIQANHTSELTYLESVNFTMIPTSLDAGCRIQGSSVSQSWFSPFDNGTNYCNLQSVIKGSGLATTPGYVEFTNEWLCLGYSVSPCT